jgi:hypothetical protein
LPTALSSQSATRPSACTGAQQISNPSLRYHSQDSTAITKGFSFSAASSPSETAAGRQKASRWLRLAELAVLGEGKPDIETVDRMQWNQLKALPTLSLRLSVNKCNTQRQQLQYFFTFFFAWSAPVADFL